MTYLNAVFSDPVLTCVTPHDGVAEMMSTMRLAVLANRYEHHVTQVALRDEKKSFTCAFGVRGEIYSYS